MNNEKKIEIANSIISSLQNYVSEITQLGNECAYTDRILDEIMEKTDELTTDYKKLIKKSIFVVLENWSCDFESGNNMVAFDDKKKAINYMNGRITEIKQEYDYDTCEEDEDDFSAFNEGYYAENHTDIRIEELEINKWV